VAQLLICDDAKQFKLVTEEGRTSQNGPSAGKADFLILFFRHMML
jgi:hypothetical protein